MYRSVRSKQNEIPLALGIGHTKAFLPHPILAGKKLHFTTAIKNPSWLFAPTVCITTASTLTSFPTLSTSSFIPRMGSNSSVPPLVTRKIHLPLHHQMRRSHCHCSVRLQ